MPTTIVNHNNELVDFLQDVNYGMIVPQKARKYKQI